MKGFSTWLHNSWDSAGTDIQWEASAYSSVKMGKPSCGPSVCAFFLKVLGLWNVGLPQSTWLLLYHHKAWQNPVTGIYLISFPVVHQNVALRVEPDCCDSGHPATHPACILLLLSHSGPREGKNCQGSCLHIHVNYFPVTTLKSFL